MRLVIGAKIAVVFILLASFCFGQKSGQYILFLDKADKTPIEGVRLHDSDNLHYGISKRSGLFEISELPKDGILYAKHVSYYPKRIQITGKSADTLGVFLLTRPVEIEAIKAEVDFSEKLINAAFRKSKQNFHTIPLQLKAEFSEKIYADDSLILHLSGEIVIHKFPPADKKKDKLKFSRLELKHYSEKHFLWDYLYFINAPYELIYSDFVKYRKHFLQIPVIQINFLREKHFRFYRYNTYLKPDKYLIEFRPDTAKRRGVYEGEIFINRSDSAFLQMEYRYAESRMGRVRNNPSYTEMNLAEDGVLIPETRCSSRVKYRKTDFGYIPESINNIYGFLLNDGSRDEIPEILVKDNLKIISLSAVLSEKISIWNQIPRGIDLKKAADK